MSWTPQIRCVGRNYPNAPLPSRIGSLGRGPGYFFGIFSQGWNSSWPPNDTALPIRYVGPSPAAGMDRPCNWQWNTTQPGSLLHVRVTLERNGTGGFQQKMLIRKIGLPNQTDALFIKDFPNGFPHPWPNSYVLPLLPGWTWPGGNPPTQMTVFIWHYSQMAPNTCLA